MLIHGHPFDRSLWRPQQRFFVEAGYRVVAPDLRGYGGSPATSGTVTMAELAGDVAALIDRLGLRGPVVIGLSGPPPQPRSAGGFRQAPPRLPGSPCRLTLLCQLRWTAPPAGSARCQGRGTASSSGSVAPRKGRGCLPGASNKGAVRPALDRPQGCPGQVTGQVPLEDRRPGKGLRAPWTTPQRREARAHPPRAPGGRVGRSSAQHSG